MIKKICQLVVSWCTMHLNLWQRRYATRRPLLARAHIPLAPKHANPVIFKVGLIGIGLSFLFMPLVASADIKPDPLQAYRDEIKRTEADASQTVLDQLGAGESNSSPDTVSAPADASAPRSTPPPPTSNRSKAFSTPQQTQAAESNTDASRASDNPWLKPNPWAAPTNLNPWANAPTTSAGNTSSTKHAAQTPRPTSPPNIFAVPR